MYLKRCLTLVFIHVTALGLFAQIPQNGLDVQHYRFAVEINDSNNIIRGDAVINIRYTREVNETILDLVKKNSGGKGMTVIAVINNKNNISFQQDDQHLIIKEAVEKGKDLSYEIQYEGVPADGLIISKTKFGTRSFFCDHWPNRAHNWLPCNDHLSDKASVEFLVTAPDHYQVVANGVQVEENNLPHHLRMTHWKEDVPLATKVMAFGAADFSVNLAGFVGCIPVSSWVYSENREQGFSSYAIAKQILEFYQKNLGPYAFLKLANVQSKTIFGGLENANTIFYSENSVTEPGVEGLIAHEVAHQWFGNAATETDWPHIWLSEGFATYMTHLYHEHKYGVDSLQSRMKKDRDDIIYFSKTNPIPVVNTTSPVNAMALLNANSYQKGGWILHMLRKKIGDSLFWDGLRLYYATYSGHNANTDDFKHIMETISKQDLTAYFHQWIFTAGHPILKVKWTYDQHQKSAAISIEQLQPALFSFPLSVAFKNKNHSLLKTIQVSNKISTINIPVDFVPSELIADPNTELLSEITVTQPL